MIKLCCVITVVFVLSMAQVSLGKPQRPPRLEGGFRPLDSVRFRDDLPDESSGSGRLNQRRLQRQQPPPDRRRRPDQPSPPSRGRPPFPPPLPPPPPPPPRRRPPQEPIQPVQDTRKQRPAAAASRQRPSTPAQPARTASHLFVRPEFDVFGNPITFQEIVVPENEELPDFRRRPEKKKNRKKPKLVRPPKTNLGPDLIARLPVFGQPDAILQATEELRSRDVNHEIIVPIGSVNAGVLPLADSSDSNDLGLFPPFAPTS